MKSLQTLAVSATLALMACGDDNAVAHDVFPMSSFEDSSSSSETTVTNSSSDVITSSSSSDVIATSSSSEAIQESSSSTVPAKFSNGSIITDGRVIDLRNGKTYKTTVIGNQVWMAENLTLDVQSLLQNETYPSYKEYEGYRYESIYYYLKDIYEDYEWVIGNPYPREQTNYYPWTIAIDSAGIFSTNAIECAKTDDCSGNGFIRGICPEGFHIPDSLEVEQLYRAIGGKCTVPKLKAKNASWSESSYSNYNDGTDDYGFAALPTGYIGWTYDDGFIAYFTNSPYPTVFFATKRLNTWGINKDQEVLFISNYDNEIFGLIPVRCLRDEPAGVDWVDPPEPTAPELPEFEYGEFTDTRDSKTYKTVVVNGKTWMDQNLAYSLTEDDFEEVYKLQGSRPPNELNYTCEHPLIGTHVSCDYKFKIDSTYCKTHETSCKNYGKFYTWYEANVVCPAGWRLPTIEEMDDFLDSPNPYVVYKGECFIRGVSFGRLMDKDFNNLLEEDLGKHNNYEFWTSTEASHNKNYVNTSLVGGLSKGATANVRCIKE